MDQSFFLRAKRLLEQRQPLDYRALLATLKERQAATPTAAAASRCCAAAPALEDVQAICALLEAKPNWRQVVQLQGGCFNRAVAVRPVNRP
jgi:hypothetical protein